MVEVRIGEPIAALDLGETYRGFEISTEGAGATRTTIVRRDGEKLWETRGYDLESARSWIDSYIGEEGEPGNGGDDEKVPPTKYEGLKKKIGELMNANKKISDYIQQFKSRYRQQIKELRELEKKNGLPTPPPDVEPIEPEEPSRFGEKRRALDDIGEDLRDIVKKMKEIDSDFPRKPGSSSQRRELISMVKKIGQRLDRLESRTKKQRIEGPLPQAMSITEPAGEINDKVEKILDKISNLQGKVSRALRRLGRPPKEPTPEPKPPGRGLIPEPKPPGRGLLPRPPEEVQDRQKPAPSEDMIERARASAGEAAERIKRAVPGMGVVGDFNYKGYDVMFEGAGTSAQTIVEKDGQTLTEMRGRQPQKARALIDEKVGEDSEPAKNGTEEKVTPGNFEEMKNMLNELKKRHVKLRDKLNELKSHYDDMNKVIRALKGEKVEPSTPKPPGRRIPPGRGGAYIQGLKESLGDVDMIPSMLIEKLKDRAESKAKKKAKKKKSKKFAEVIQPQKMESMLDYKERYLLNGAIEALDEGRNGRVSPKRAVSRARKFMDRFASVKGISGIASLPQRAKMAIQRAGSRTMSDRYGRVGHIVGKAYSMMNMIKKKHRFSEDDIREIRGRLRFAEQNIQRERRPKTSRKGDYEIFREMGIPLRATRDSVPRDGWHGNYKGFSLQVMPAREKDYIVQVAYQTSSGSTTSKRLADFRGNNLKDLLEKAKRAIDSEVRGDGGEPEPEPEGEYEIHRAGAGHSMQTQVVKDGEVVETFTRWQPEKARAWVEQQNGTISAIYGLDRKRSIDLGMEV